MNGDARSRSKTSESLSKVHSSAFVVALAKGALRAKRKRRENGEVNPRKQKSPSM